MYGRKLSLSTYTRRILSPMRRICSKPTLVSCPAEQFPANRSRPTGIERSCGDSRHRQHLQERSAPACTAFCRIRRGWVRKRLRSARSLLSQEMSSAFVSVRRLDPLFFLSKYYLCLSDLCTLLPTRGEKNRSTASQFHCVFAYSSSLPTSVIGVRNPCRVIICIKRNSNVSAFITFLVMLKSKGRLQRRGEIQQLTPANSVGAFQTQIMDYFV
jgi:hypothetical protein